MDKKMLICSKTNDATATVSFPRGVWGKPQQKHDLMHIWAKKQLWWQQFFCYFFVRIK